jgi:hypothetical protein
MNTNKYSPKVKANLPTYIVSKFKNICNSLFKDSGTYTYHAVTLSYNSQKRVIVISFLLIPMLLLFLFLFYPAAKMFYYSFFDW